MQNIKSQEALSPGIQPTVPLLLRAMSTLTESGRQALEKWLVSESNAKSSDQPQNFASPKSSDSEAKAPKKWDENFSCLSIEHDDL